MIKLIRLAALVLFAVLFLGPAWAQTTKPAKGEKTDAQVRQELVTQSIGGYSGNCPCPYNTDRAGRRCGRRSAYNRPGGAAPVCYPEDVTPKMIAEYRKRSK